MPANEQNQTDFIAMVLHEAAEHNFPFVINWVPIDYNKLIKKLPKELQDVATIWVHTGMLDKNLKPKPALSVWQEHLQN